MVEADAKGRPKPDRVLGPLESLPLGPLWLWAAVAAGTVSVYLAWHAIFGPYPWMYDAEYPLSITPHNATHLIVAVLIAFLLVTRRHESRQVGPDLARLRAATHLPEREFATLVARSPAQLRRRRVWQALGAALGVVMIVAASRDPFFILRRETWDAHFVWNVASMMLLFGLLGTAAYETLLGRREFSRIIGRIAQVDLLDRAGLAPLSAPGLRRAFYFVAGSCLASPLALYLDRGWPVLLVVAATLAIATSTFLGPASAIRARVLRAKAEELARVRAQIALARQRALDAGGSLDGEGAAHLPGLLAYESRVESVTGWPFDTPTLLRFSALVVLAAGSWLGGAVVERLLGSVLDSG